MAKNVKQQAAIAMSMKAAGKKPKMGMGGYKYAAGGSTTNKLAGMYGDPTKVTRGDVITAAKKNAGTMKKGGSVKKKK